MKSQLSKRERFLILFAAAFGLVFISFQYGIAPAYNAYTARIEQYDELSYEKDVIDLKFDNEGFTRKAFEKAQESYDAISERIPYVMSTEDVDRILTGLCLQNKLYPVSLGMSGVVPYVEPPAEGENADSTDAQPKSHYSIVTATMGLQGDYDALKGLIDTVEGMDYIRIIRTLFQYSDNTNRLTGTNISVFFEVTMLNKPE